MRKIILLMLIGLIILPVIYADMVYVNNSFSDLDHFNVDDANWGAQTFIPSTTFNLTKINLRLYDSGVTHFNVSLKAVDALGKPTGADLSFSTNNTPYLSGVILWYNFTMPIYELQAGTQYAIVARATRTGTAYGRWRRDSISSNGIPSGSIHISVDSGASWNDYMSGADFLMELYGDDYFFFNITSPLNQTYAVNETVFNLTTVSTFTECQYSLDNWATNQTMAIYDSNNAYNITNLTGGSKYLQFWCINPEGLTYQNGVNFSLELSFPVVNSTTLRNQELRLYGSNITVNFTLSDETSDFNYVDVYIGGVYNFTKLTNNTGGWYLNITTNTTLGEGIRLLLNDSANHQINYTYPYYVINYAVNYTPKVSELDTTQFNITFNTSNVGSAGAVNITGDFYHNNTFYNHTTENRFYQYCAPELCKFKMVKFKTNLTVPSIALTQNVTFYYDLYLYDIGSTSYNYYNVSRTQEIVASNLSSGSCVFPYTRTLDIFNLEETTGINVSASLGVTFFLKNNGVNLKNVSFNYTPAFIHNVCLYPNYANYTADAIMTYYAPDYDYRNYYLYDYPITNITNQIYLYLINSSVSENIYIYARDENDAPLRFYRIEILRYYPESNIYKTVQMEETDYNGLFLAKLIPYNIFYKFILKNADGDIIGETPARLIMQSTIYLQFNLFGDPLQSIEDVNNVGYTLVWNNASGAFTYTFSDSSGIIRDGCLRVEKVSASEFIDVCYDCLTASTGTIVCTLGGNLTGTYIAHGLINTSTNHSMIEIEHLSKTFERLTGIIGLNGVLLAFILIGTIAFIGLWNPSVSIFLCIVGFVFSALLGLVAVELSTLVGLVIAGIIYMVKLKT